MITPEEYDDVVLTISRADLRQKTAILQDVMLAAMQRMHAGLHSVISQDERGNPTSLLLMTTEPQTIAKITEAIKYPPTELEEQ